MFPNSAPALERLDIYTFPFRNNFPRLWAPLIAYHLNKLFHFICSPKLSQIYFVFLEPFDWKFTFLFALKHGNSGLILIGNQAIKGNGLNTGLTSLAALHTTSFPGSLSEEKRERAWVRGCFAQTISHPIMQCVLGVLYIKKKTIQVIYSWDCVMPLWTGYSSL